MKTIQHLLYILIVVIFASCSSKMTEPQSVSINQTVSIFPDYAGVTVPANIAPLNFYIEEKGIEYQANFVDASGNGFVVKSDNGVVDIPLKKWHKMLASNAGKSINVKIFVKDNSGKWVDYQIFTITVSSDNIDSHLAYRIINVGYILWNKLGLYQRDLTSFRQTAIMLNRNTEGNCMNCHNFNQQDPEQIMFHMRGKYAGTVIARGDEVKKVNTKTPVTMSAAAYPSWHPGGKHIAFSVNLISQWFHGVDKKNEVYDRASDIVVYDIENNEITTSPLVSTRQRESLPNWSPDGKYIYFCRTEEVSESIAWDEVVYDLCRISYDVETKTWGTVETVLSAAQAGGSITFPKISPDGKWLMFTLADHGYFSIFNKSSDLYLLNLETNDFFPFPFNSGDVDSYHSWSGNSRWIAFSSKRLDGLCTRPYFTHVDEKGNFSKPFVMPQRDPLFYRSYKDNYNVPELVNGKVNINRASLLEAARDNALQANFDPNIDVDGLSGASRIEQSVLH